MTENNCGKFEFTEEELNEKIETARAEGYKNGYDEGYKRGFDAGYSRCAREARRIEVADAIYDNL